MMQKFFNITFSTALELFRQPIFLILLAGPLVFMVLLASTFYTGIGEDPHIVKQSVLALIFVIGLFSAALNASTSVAREIRNGTALAVLSKPVGRTKFLLAKFTGLSLALALQIGVQLFGALSASRMAFDAWGSPDWFAISIILGALALALLAAAAGNFFAQRPFTSDAVLAVSGFMAIAFVAIALFNRAGELQPFGANMDWRLIPAILLIYFALLVLQAVAVACSTRLETVATLVVCSGVFLIGLMSDYFFGRADAQGSFIADALHTIFPNWQLFWMADALADKKTIPWHYVVNTAAYVAGFLVLTLSLAMALFEDRELN